jgi:uracil DNA glycosylase
MQWEKFADQFDESWHYKMKPFIESEACDAIYEFLKKEAKRGKKIAPLSSNTFRAFKETKFTDVKVIMIGMCPYHTFKNNEPIADGLLMGCSTTGYPQPSLDNFYNALEKEFHDGLNLKMIKNPDVTYLANQGVLMLNAALTVENVLDTTGAPIIFLGKDAAKYERYVAPFTWTFTLSHPASASYKNTDWDTEGVFKKVSEIVKQNNNLEIDWLDVNPPF